MPRERSQSDANAVSPAAPRRLSRRRFLALIAAGGAALPAGALGATATKRMKGAPARGRPAAGALHLEPTPSYAAPPTPGPAIMKGLKEQRESLAGQLKTIRDLDLAPGSEQAFAFRPLRRMRRPR